MWLQTPPWPRVTTAGRWGSLAVQNFINSNDARRSPADGPTSLITCRTCRGIEQMWRKYRYQGASGASGATLCDCRLCAHLPVNSTSIFVEISHCSAYYERFIFSWSETTLFAGETWKSLFLTLLGSRSSFLFFIPESDINISSTPLFLLTVRCSLIPWSRVIQSDIFFVPFSFEIGLHERGVVMCWHNVDDDNVRFSMSTKASSLYRPKHLIELTLIVRKTCCL